MANVFKLEELPGPIAVLTFDTPEKKVNTLGRAVLEELGQIVAQLEKRTDLHGLLLRSGKSGQFIAGADLKELGALVYLTAEQLRVALSQGHALFDRVSNLPFPTVSLIDGPCMGGGTELSLALDERLASNNPKTRIGLPEVTIGLIPGWGGTQRLPRLVGLHHAIDMICTGEPVTPQKAAAIGLVFDAMPAEKLVEEGCRVAEFLYASGAWKQSREQRRQPLGLSQDQMLFSFACAEGQIKAKTKGQPSAAPVALKALQKGVNLPLDEGLAVERKTAEEVVGSEMSANLIGVFFMNTALGRDRGVADENVQARPVRRAGVLGSGLMGAGIATAHARSGIPCGMVDVSEERLADGLARAQKVVMSRIEIGRASPADMVQLLSHLNTSTSHSLFADCDVVVEAITENEELKTQSYRQLAGVMRDDAILATNTSTISITRMAQAAKHPEKFVGMHFFFPVDRMQLVEVIRGDKTSDETVVTIVELARRLRKTPIVCNDCPGFLVNRILMPYMNEAVVLLLEGAGLDQIDKVATRFGFPMGPIALHDLVGLDTAFYAGGVMLAGYRDRTVETPLLGDLVKAGRLGKKSGAGFRKFVGKKGTPTTDPEFTPILERDRISSRQVSDEEVEDRLLLTMLLEAVRLLEERIVREPMHVDMGLILGIGFPPFRGGLLKWCDNVGAAKILERTKKYSHLGKRFEPTEQFVAMAQRREVLSEAELIQLKCDIMRHAVIIDAIRTPIAKASSDSGYFRSVRADDLSAHIMRALVERTGINPHLIDDVRWGCVMQQGEQGIDIARIAGLIAGLPIETGGVTINRNCASGLQAINDCAMNIAAGCEDVQIAGGVEHMDHIPMTKGYESSPGLLHRFSEAIMQMGLTAEYLALKYGVNRRRQDEFALRSHQLAAQATSSGAFASEIAPTWGHDPAGHKIQLTCDQGIRADTSIEALSALAPAFNPEGGSVTAGNSSQVSVGAAALLVMSEDKAKELGMKPLARIKAMAVAGVDPCEMGIGPVPAIHKVLSRANLKLADIGCIEINEAFAVQVLSVLKLLGINEEKVNTRGGALALGHPLGASGARVATTLLYRMRYAGAKYGIATLCIGQGQGLATVFESCE